MIIERIVYCLVCLILFVYIIKKYLNSKSGIYLSLLAVQFVCMVTQLIALFNKIYVDAFMQIYVLLFNVLIPAAIFIADYLNINFEEFIEIKLGDFYAKNSKYDKAIEKYKKAVSKNNNNAQTFAKLGRVYNAKGDRRTAFDRFARAIEINRNDYRSYYEIGVIFNDMGKHADAQIVLDNSLRIKPDFTPASELLAVVLCAQNKYDEAINVYKNATRYDSDNYELYYRMGVVSTELRDFNDAKAWYEKAIELNPSLYQAYFSLGQINLLKGELNQAENMFKKSMVSKELTAKSYYQLAKVYILNDEEIKAVTYLGYAIDIDSSYKYKAESEPLFAKIKDYITGLSMANRVMQQAENIETLKKYERVESDSSEDIAKHVASVMQEENTQKIEQEVEDITSKANDEESDVTASSSEQKESKFFKMMKNVLGFEEINEDVEEESNELLENNERLENSKSIENSKVSEFSEVSQSSKYSEGKKHMEEYKAFYGKAEEVEETETAVVNAENENQTTYDFEKATDDSEKEHSSTLDIFEKFKKLKKEEEEKAERYRRIQKMKQLEELKNQEAKTENNENEKYYDENSLDYYNEDEPVVVRTVGTCDSEEARKELNRLEELRKLRNFEIEKQQYRKAYEEKTEPNETFEDEDTMEEPHFDFMDRFKRR